MPNVNIADIQSIKASLGDRGNGTLPVTPSGPNPFKGSIDSIASSASSEVNPRGGYMSASIGMGSPAPQGIASVAPPERTTGIVPLSGDFSPGYMTPELVAQNMTSASAGAVGKPMKMPSGPGTTMLNLLTLGHMEKTAADRLGPKVANPTLQDVFTRHKDALKLAIQTLGVAGPNNPMGLDVDMGTAREVWFGSKDAKVSSQDEAAFNAIAQRGDQKLDKKLLQQYVNYDGSTTYEVLNPDKSVKSRFTFGSNEGKKIFVQGGYNEYASELGNFKTMFSQNDELAAKFEATRQNILSKLGGM